MTPNEFRELALSFAEVIESAHMHHPDFRVGGRIFATLGYPGLGDGEAIARGAKRICPNQSGRFHTGERRVWAAGATNINLPVATIKIVREALTAAWRNTAPKRLSKNR